MNPVDLARPPILAAALACAGGHGVEPAPPRPAEAAAPAPAAPAASVPAAPTAGGLARPAPKTVPREYLITLAPDAADAVIGERFGALGIASVRSLGRNVFLVTFRADPGLGALEDVRKEDGRIQSVQPNFVYRTTD